MTDVVITEAHEGVLTITLNRPESKNAVNRALALRMVEAIDELENNPDLRAAIITGAGGTFCSGVGGGASSSISIANWVEWQGSGTSQPQTKKSLFCLTAASVAGVQCRKPRRCTRTTTSKHGTTAGTNRGE